MPSLGVSLPDRVADMLPARVGAHHVFLALFGLHVVIKTFLYFRAWQAPYIGDETAYVDGARAVSNLLRDLGLLQSPDTAEIHRSLVGSGWFMPGMAMLLAPLFLVVPDAGLELVRLYLGVVTSVLLLMAALTVRRLLGPVAGCAVLVVPGLVPMWMLFSFSVWGDLCAGLVVVVMLAETIVLLRQLVAGAAPGVGDGVRFGLLAVTALYFRSSTQPLVFGLFLLLLLAVIVLGAGRVRVRGLLSVAVAAVVFVGLLLPWSLTASAALDGRVVTTTSMSASLGNTFGDQAQMCFGPCDPGSSQWFAPLRYARETARATGRSEVEVLPQMSAYARADVTPGSYSADVLDNFGRYTMAPFGFEYLLRPPDSSFDPVSAFVWGGTAILYYPLFLAMLVLLLLRVRGPLDLQLRVVVVKLAMLALVVQPFVHVASTRYWPTFAPVLALAGLLLVEALRSPQPAGAPGRPALAVALDRFQMLIAGFVLLLGGTLAVLALGHLLTAR